MKTYSIRLPEEVCKELKKIPVQEVRRILTIISGFAYEDDVELIRFVLKEEIKNTLDKRVK